MVSLEILRTVVVEWQKPGGKGVRGNRREGALGSAGRWLLRVLNRRKQKWDEEHVRSREFLPCGKF